MTTPEPQWDPLVRWRVQHALNQVLLTARDVLMRYADDNGQYAAPSEVAELGDVTGLMATGNEQVVKRLQATLDEATAVMAEVRELIDQRKRELYGPGYQPHRPDGSNQFGREQ